jgi:hypothetical protein
MKKLTFLILITFLTNSLIAQDKGFLLETDKYRITFPGKPVDQVQPVQSELGELKLYIHIYEVPNDIDDGNHTFGMIESAYPADVISSDKKELLDKFFRGAVDGSAKNINGRLLTESRIQLNGYPGRQFKVDYQDGLAIVTMRCYLVKNVLYMLQVISEGKRDDNPANKKFLDSFMLK